jgi:hypothetical protein
MKIGKGKGTGRGYGRGCHGRGLGARFESDGSSDAGLTDEFGGIHVAEEED